MENNNNNNNNNGANNNKGKQKLCDLTLAQIEEFLKNIPIGQILSPQDEEIRLSLIDRYLSSFPSGYKFDPSDEELIVDYLFPKINGANLPVNLMHEVNIYKHNPEYLAAAYKAQGNKGWYFFTSRDKKYKNGFRPNRKAGEGFWKATGADKVIRRNNIEVGFRKALVFYQGRPPKGKKTFWIMHEFRVASDPKKKKIVSTNSKEDTSMRLDDYILCRIYLKTPKAPSKNKPPPEDEDEDLERFVEGEIEVEISPKDSDDSPPSNNNVDVYAIDETDANNFLYGPSNGKGVDNGITMQNSDRNNKGKNVVVETSNNDKFYDTIASNKGIVFHETGHNNGGDYVNNYHQTNYNSVAYNNGYMYPGTYYDPMTMIPSTSNSNSNNYYTQPSTSNSNSNNYYTQVWSSMPNDFSSGNQYPTYVDPSTSSSSNSHDQTPDEYCFFDDPYDNELIQQFLYDKQPPSMSNLLGPIRINDAANVSHPHQNPTDDKVDVKPLGQPRLPTQPTPTPPPSHPQT